MADERLELTFTGLCVLLITGPAGTANPSNVRALMVDTTGTPHTPHAPRMSFRGIDLRQVDPVDMAPRSVQVASDGQEMIELPIPRNAEIAVAWQTGGNATRYTMAWDASDGSMRKVPDLADFNVDAVLENDSEVFARVTQLPFGTFEARRVVRGRGGPLSWSFNPPVIGLDPRPYANQVTLVSEAPPGRALLITITAGGRVTTYRFLTGDGEVPLRIALTNLPSRGRLVEDDDIGEGESPMHLNAHERVVTVVAGRRFRLFKRGAGPGATRQGTICPTVREHV